MSVSKYRDALKSMVWQFAYRIVQGGKLVLSSGGLSALEEALDVLKMSDPYILKKDEQEYLVCEVKICNEWSTTAVKCGKYRYVQVCSEHYRQTLNHREDSSATSALPCPELKDSVSIRESKRGKDGILKTDK